MLLLAATSGLTQPANDNFADGAEITGDSGTAGGSNVASNP